MKEKGAKHLTAAATQVTAGARGPATSLAAGRSPGSRAGSALPACVSSCAPMIACEMGPRTVLSRSLKAGFTRRQGQAAVRPDLSHAQGQFQSRRS